MTDVLDSFVLPLRLTPEERRDLARRLADRLGTGQAGGVSIVCEPAEVGEAEAAHVIARWRIEGNAGDVKVRGLQQLAGGARAGRWRLEQRDAIGIGGLEGGVALLLAVEDACEAPGAPAGEGGAAPAAKAAGAGKLPAWADPLARVPALVRVDLCEGSDEGVSKARDEAYRAAGERFAPLLAKKEALLLELPLAFPAEGARPFARGRFHPPPPRTGPWFGRLALVEDPNRSGTMLLVREAIVPAAEKAEALEKAIAEKDGDAMRLASRRALAPIAMLAPAAAINVRTIDRHVDRRAIEKAITALAFEATGGAPAEPRPMPRKLSMVMADAQTAGIYIGGPAKLEGEVRDFAAGTGPRSAALDLGVFDLAGARKGAIVERHLLGLPEGGFAIAATYEKTATVLISGPKKTSERWLDKFFRAL